MKIDGNFVPDEMLCYVITNLPHFALPSVFGDSVSHPYLTGLFHHDPRDEAALWIQHTKSVYVLEAAFNIFQAPLIFPKAPVLIHKPRMGGVQDDAQEVSFPVKNRERSIYPATVYQTPGLQDVNMTPFLFLRVPRPRGGPSCPEKVPFLCLFQNRPKSSRGRKSKSLYDAESAPQKKPKQISEEE